MHPHSWDLRESPRHALSPCREFLPRVSCCSPLPHHSCLSCPRPGTSLLGSGFPVRWLMPVPSHSAGCQGNSEPTMRLRVHFKIVSILQTDIYHPHGLIWSWRPGRLQQLRHVFGNTLKHPSPCSKGQVLAGLPWMAVPLSLRPPVSFCLDHLTGLQKAGKRLDLSLAISAQSCV